MDSSKTHHEISKFPQYPANTNSGDASSGVNHQNTTGTNSFDNPKLTISTKTVAASNSGPSSPDYYSRSANDEKVDPRIGVELESLNSATNEINKLEKELENANSKFRQLLTSKSAELEALGKRIGSAIDRARPFYEALAQAQNAHRACLSAATQFSRANVLHAAAKDTVALTESKFNSKCLDSVFQEVLNHATMKVMEAEKMKKESELAHRLRAEEFTVAESKVHELEKHLNREIEKSRPYFELKNALNVNLSFVKTEIESLQNTIIIAKKTYSDSLRRLEAISEEIHEQRRRKGNNNNNRRKQSNSKDSGKDTSSSSSSSSAASSAVTSANESPNLNLKHSQDLASNSVKEEVRGMNRIMLERRSSPIGAEAEDETFETGKEKETGKSELKKKAAVNFYTRQESSSSSSSSASNSYNDEMLCKPVGPRYNDNHKNGCVSDENGSNCE